MSSLVCLEAGLASPPAQLKMLMPENMTQLNALEEEVKSQVPGSVPWGEGKFLSIPPSPHLVINLTLHAG